MNARKKYRRFVCFLLFVSILALGYCSVEAIRNEIPDSIRISEYGELPELFRGRLGTAISVRMQEDADAKAAADDADDGSTSAASADAGDAANDSSTSAASAAEGRDSYTLSYHLFGTIPLKTVSVSVSPRPKVYAGGTPIGIYLETDGVLVVDTGTIEAADGGSCCPAENIVKSGDYIQSVNGEPVATKEELISCIGKSNGEDIVLDVDRAGEQISLRLQPVQDEQGKYRAGIWVRNDTQGIGTITYMKEDGTFGALGHGISDIDTGEILDVCGGTLYDADVLSVIKGQQGIPGELSGVIHYSEGYRIGNIEENCSAGIFGRLANLPGLIQDKQQYEIAYKQEAEPGEAVILSSVDGECREYQVEIQEIRMNGTDENKGMILQVTDEELLNLTGGIVQGMSGSPILQNGRIVGAVTHVFVNDPTKGYGIFIENMLEH